MRIWAQVILLHKIWLPRFCSNYINVHSKSKFATRVWFPNKQNEGISVPKNRAIRICRTCSICRHEAAYLPYFDDREMVGPTFQSSLPMEENNLITTEGKRCCGHSVKEENYTACIGNSLVFIPLCRPPQCIQSHITYSTSECMTELYDIHPYFLHSLHLGRISELERKILSPCRNNIESALCPMWTFYNFCDASTMDWIHRCAHPVSPQLQCLPGLTTEASQGLSKQFSHPGRGKWISGM